MDLILPSCVGSPEAGADAIPYSEVTSVENDLYLSFLRFYVKDTVLIQ